MKFYYNESEEFTYMKSVVSTTRGTEQDVEARQRKAKSTSTAINKP